MSGWRNAFFDGGCIELPTDPIVCKIASDVASGAQETHVLGSYLAGRGSEHDFTPVIYKICSR